MLIEINGIGISGQNASAKAFVCKKRPNIYHSLVKKSLKNDKTRLEEIINIANEQVQKLLKLAKEDHNAWQIFETHELLLKDPELKKYMLVLLEQGYDLLSALIRTEEDMKAHFQCMESEAFRTKVSDIEDVFERLIRIETGSEERLIFPNKPFILICDEILPSMLYQANNGYLKGVLVRYGSNCSHGTVLAKQKNIPVIIRLKNRIDLIIEDTIVSMNGESGNVFISNN